MYASYWFRRIWAFWDKEESSPAIDERVRELKLNKKKPEDLKSENTRLSSEPTIVNKRMYRYNNISENSTLFLSETGLEREAFEDFSLPY